MVLENLKGFGKMTLQGIVATQAPVVLKGMLNELLRRDDITVAKVVVMVEKNQSLWSHLSPEITHSLYRAAERVPDIDFLTVEWFIDAIREDHRALASLFLGWKKARNWLTRQIEAIKAELYPVEDIS